MGKALTKAEREKKKKLFLEAYEDSKAMTTTSCERAGISRVTLEKWRKDDPDFDEAINVIKEKTREYVEGQLMTLINRGTPSAIYFWLKCRAGYHETARLEVEHADAIDVKAALEEIKSELQKSDE